MGGGGMGGGGKGGGQGGLQELLAAKLMQMVGQGGAMGGGGMGGGGNGAAAFMQMMGQQGMAGKGAAAPLTGWQWMEGGVVGGGKCGGGKGGSKSGKAKGQGKSQKRTVDGVVIKTLGENLAWKGRLMHAFCATHKCICSKESLVYTTTEEGDGFVCYVNSDKFEDVYGSEGACSTIKQAEENAAMVTMKAEFPAHYKSAPQAAKKMGADLSHEHTAEEKAGLCSGGKDPTSVLIHSLNVVFGRTLEKGEIVTTVQDIGGWAFKATCTISCADPPRSFQGEQIIGTSKQNRKEAQHSAAQAALEGFKDEIDVAMPVHLAKKAARAAEQLALRARYEVDNAAEAARAEAAGEPPPAKRPKSLKKK